MKYIEKHLEAKEVLEYEAELEENDLDKSSLSDALVHPSTREIGRASCRERV